MIRKLPQQPMAMNRKCGVDRDRVRYIVLSKSHLMFKCRKLFRNQIGEIDVLNNNKGVVGQSSTLAYPTHHSMARCLPTARQGLHNVNHYHYSSGQSYNRSTTRHCTPFLSSMCINKSRATNSAGWLNRFDLKHRIRRSRFNSAVGRHSPHLCPLRLAAGASRRATQSRTASRSLE